MEENNKDQLEDAIVIMETSLEAAKEQKVALDKYCAQIAGIMEKLKTNEAKQELAEITQINYRKMLELDIKIAEMENQLKAMKIHLILGE